MLYFIGSKNRRKLITSVYERMCVSYPQLREIEVNVNTKGLKREGVTGWCYPMEDSWEIEIETTLDHVEYVDTLCHEMIHIVQDLDENFDVEEREREAYGFEGIYGDLIRQMHRTL